MARDTGSVHIDAEHDFLRARRHQTLAALAARLREDHEDVTQTLSFDDVVNALGRRSERPVGTLEIPLEAIIGSVDKARDFDRRFRPTSGRSRQRWERLARASRKGEFIPPIDVYQLGDHYFVQDGHHRVSVARALGLETIEANVTLVQTVLPPMGILTRKDIDRSHWQRIFLQRVPLTAELLPEVEVTDPIKYGVIAEMVEAWSARLMHAEKRYIGLIEVAQRWFSEDFKPVVTMIDDAGVRGDDETKADAYIRVSGERYRLIREHLWNTEVLEQIADAKQRRRRT